MPSHEEGLQSPTLGEIAGAVTRRKRLLAAVTLFFAVLGALVAVITEPRYEGRARIEIARFASTGGEKAWPQLAETTHQAAARILGYEFGTAVLRELKVDLQSSEARLLLDSIRAQALPQTDFVELRLRAASVGRARQFIETVTAVLAKAHSQIVDRQRYMVQARLRAIDSQLEEVKKLEAYERRRLKRNLENTLSLSACVVVVRSQTLHALARERFSLEEALSLAGAQDRTRLVDVFVDEKPVTPRPEWVIFVASVGGLFIATLVILFSYRRQSNGN